MTETLTITINRPSGSYATSFLLWAKFQTFPQTDGDGTFVGEVEIGADEDSVTLEWDSPNNSVDWRFIAIPRFLDQTGLPGRLEAV